MRRVGFALLLTAIALAGWLTLQALLTNAPPPGTYLAGCLDLGLSSGLLMAVARPGRNDRDR